MGGKQQQQEENGEVDDEEDAVPMGRRNKPKKKKISGNGDRHDGQSGGGRGRSGQQEQLSHRDNYRVRGYLMGELCAARVRCIHLLHHWHLKVSG